MLVYWRDFQKTDSNYISWYLSFPLFPHFLSGCHWKAACTRWDGRWIITYLNELEKWEDEAVNYPAQNIQLLEVVVYLSFGESSMYKQVTEKTCSFDVNLLQLERTSWFVRLTPECENIVYQKRSMLNVHFSLICDWRVGTPRICYHCIYIWNDVLKVCSVITWFNHLCMIIWVVVVGQLEPFAFIELFESSDLILRHFWTKLANNHF